MKVTTILSTCGAVMAAALLAVSCVKETGKEVALEQYDFSNKAFVQVYNATVGSLRTYVYVDGAPANGASAAYPATFPVTPSNFGVTAGLRNFLIRDTLGSSTQPIMSFAETLQANAYYTIFMFDSLTTPQHKTVKNDIVIPSDTTSRVRFANFPYSPSAIPAIDIFSIKRNANIFSNVSTTEVTGYIPFASSSKTVENDTLYVRIAGSGTNLMNRTVTGSVTTFSPVQIVVAPTRLRSYTLIFRGGWRQDLSSAASVRTLSFFSGN